MNFAQFLKEWNTTDGYIPVYVYTDDDFQEEGFVQILLDMVVPERLLDGKIKCIAVKMERKDLPEFHAYLAKMGDYLKSSLTKTNEQLLRYSNNFE